jgi:hypothetical protein
MSVPRLAGAAAILLLVLGSFGCTERPADLLSSDASNTPASSTLFRSGSDADSSSPTTGDFCVLLEDDFQGALADVAADYDLALVESFGKGRLGLMRGTADPLVLSKDSRVEEVQTNELSTLSAPVELTMSFYEGELSETLPAQESFRELHLDRVHRRSTGRGVKVAILDTGIDPTHPLLKNRAELIPAGHGVLGSIDTPMGVDTDGDGAVDEAYGHGTHVAGIIATIAPGATILPIRVLDSDGAGSAFDLAMGLFKAQELGADIVNLSLVLTDETDVIEVVLRALSASGIVVVGAAGNVPGEIWFPASDSHVLSVAASVGVTEIAAFSATKDAWLAAPGVGIQSLFPGGRVAVGTGTSMACAVVSGAVAVLSEKLLDPFDAVELLRATAIELDPIEDGHLDLESALSEIGIGKGQGEEAVGF